MLIPKSLLEPLPATMAHLDELLDEALKDTFQQAILSPSMLRLNRLSTKHPDPQRAKSENTVKTNRRQEIRCCNEEAIGAN
jgi:hypothetical protein